MGGSYDEGKFTTRRVMPIAASGGISVPGTASSTTELVRLVILDSITIDAARMVAMTGGTAAGPTVLLQKSLAGTGTATSFGTKAFGTAADNAAFNFSPTSTTFVAGDHLIIANLAGTSAATPKANITIGYLETFPTP